MFAVLMYVLGRLKVEQEVDIFSKARQVKSRKPQILPSQVKLKMVKLDITCRPGCLHPHHGPAITQLFCTPKTSSRFLITLYQKDLTSRQVCCDSIY